MRPAARRRPGLFPAVAALCCLARLAPRAAAGGRQGAGAGGLVPCAGSARQAFHRDQRAALASRAAALASGAAVRCSPEEDAPVAVTLVTLAAGLDGSYVSALWRHREAYALRRGYAYCQVDWLDPLREPNWSKLPALAHVLRTRNTQWAWWLDSDALVANFGLRVEALLPGAAVAEPVASLESAAGVSGGHSAGDGGGDGDVMLVFTAENDCCERDGAASAPNHRVATSAVLQAVSAAESRVAALNSGVFFVRRSAWSLEWLEERIYLTPYGTPDCGRLRGRFFDAEQGAISRWIRAEPAEVARRAVFFGGDAFNAHPMLFKPGDGVLHAAGLADKYALLGPMAMHGCFVADTEREYERHVAHAMGREAAAEAEGTFGDDDGEAGATRRLRRAMAQEGPLVERVRAAGLAAPLTSTADPELLALFEKATGGEGFAAPLAALAAGVARDVPGEWHLDLCTALANHAGDKLAAETVGVDYGYGAERRTKRCEPDWAVGAARRAGVGDR